VRKWSRKWKNKRTGARESRRRDEIGKIKEEEGAGATGSLVDLLQPRLYAR